MRDCVGGQGQICSKDMPCTPCERDTLPVSSHVLKLTNDIDVVNDMLYVDF